MLKKIENNNLHLIQDILLKDGLEEVNAELFTSSYFDWAKCFPWAKERMDEKHNRFFSSLRVAATQQDALGPHSYTPGCFFQIMNTVILRCLVDREVNRQIGGWIDRQAGDR